MILYVASRSSNSNFALLPENVVGVPSKLLEPAQERAAQHSQNTEEPTWVFKVDIESLGGYRMEKRMVSRGFADEG
jgi:hypothetical protein